MKNSIKIGIIAASFITGVAAVKLVKDLRNRKVDKLVDEYLINNRKYTELKSQQIDKITPETRNCKYIVLDNRTPEVNSENHEKVKKYTA